MKNFFILTLLVISSTSFACSDVLNSTLRVLDSDDEKNLCEYAGNVVLVVNVASRCGYTPQYDALQKLWSNYKSKDLVVIGVPTNNFKQEPGTNKQIKDFCETNFGINFPMTEKTDVIGNNAHPFYKWAKKNHGIGAIPKWNFHKIIVGKNGKIYDTFASFTKPDSKKFLSSIENAIKN